VVERRLLDLSYSGDQPIASAADLIQQYGSRIAQVVRGDTGRLAESECNEVLQSRISYYANDLAVIGWNAAFVYDSTSARRQRSSCSSMRTPNCLSSAIMTIFLPKS
jgi:hypothetical protein